jgi:hypothetical protein
MMMAAGAGWGNSTLDLRKAADNVVDQYFSAIWYLPAADYVVDQAAYIELTLSHRAYFAEVAKGVIISFICTNPTCKYRATQNYWIPGGDIDHIQCPLCKLLIELEKALVVLSVTDPLSGFTFEFPCTWPRSLAVERPHLFTEDDISLDGGWLNNCVKEYAIVTPADKDLERFLQNAVISLSDFLAKIARPIGQLGNAWGPNSEKSFDDWEKLTELLANMFAGAKALSSSVVLNYPFCIRIHGGYNNFNLQ